jgi:hypothetical protein
MKRTGFGVVSALLICSAFAGQAVAKKPAAPSSPPPATDPMAQITSHLNIKASVGSKMRLASPMRGEQRLSGMAARGTVPVTGLAKDCDGMNVSAKPSHAVTVPAKLGPIRIAAYRDDARVLIRLPDGSYRCNHDGTADSPHVTIGTPAAGKYLVWVSLKADDTPQPYDLVVDLDDQSDNHDTPCQSQCSDDSIKCYDGCSGIKSCNNVCEHIKDLCWKACR